MSEYHRAMYARRRGQRVEIDGRMVAVDPRAVHGKRYTYVHWLCECTRCTQANTDYANKRQARQRRASAAA